MGGRISIVFLISVLLSLGCNTAGKRLHENLDHNSYFFNHPNLNFETDGGKGGIVFVVENHNDSGPGSLRQALEYNKPRTVIFNIFGEIKLRTRIVIKHPFITIIGSTSPKGGIIIRNAGISIQTHDVILENITLLIGDSLYGPKPQIRDGIEILGNENDKLKTYNVIIDHCSVSMAIDENVSIWGNVRNVMISNCIISYALNNSLHPKGAHSMGLLIGPQGKNITLTQNLFAYNKERNPRISNDTEVKFLNNYIFNCDSGLFIMDDPNSSEQVYTLELRDNIFYPEISEYTIRIRQTNKKSKVLASHNYDNAAFEKKIFKKNKLSSINRQNSSVIDRESLEKHIIENVGSHPKARNLLDSTLIQDLISKKKSGIIDCSSESLTWMDGTILSLKKDTIFYQSKKSLISDYKKENYFLKVADSTFKIKSMTQKHILFEKSKITTILKPGTPISVISKCENFISIN